MNGAPVLCERTFAIGRQRWRVDAAGNWSTWMWGWWPDTGASGQPSGRFVSVEKSKVPEQLLNEVKQ